VHAPGLVWVHRFILCSVDEKRRWRVCAHGTYGTRQPDCLSRAIRCRAAKEFQRSGRRIACRAHR
jgi:hypothetical protein